MGAAAQIRAGEPLEELRDPLTAAGDPAVVEEDGVRAGTVVDPDGAAVLITEIGWAPV